MKAVETLYEHDGHPVSNGRFSKLYLALAWLSAGLGFVGVFLPLLPTTPFVLLSAWAASRGSPVFAHWLESHPTFGPILENWRNNRAVPTKAKFTAGAMLSFSWCLLWFMEMPAAGLAGLGVFFIILFGFLLSRPSS